MGKTLDSALPDFHHRYAKGAKWQRLMTFTKAGTKRPPLFLRRNFPPNARKVRHAVRLRCRALVEPQFERKFKIGAVLLCITDGTNQAALEASPVGRSSCEVLLQSAQHCEPLLKAGLRLCLRVVLISNATEAKWFKTYPALSQKACSRLVAKDEREWDSRKLPRSTTSQVAANFNISATKGSKQVFTVEVAAEGGSSSTACSVEVDGEGVTSYGSRTSRLERLKQDHTNPAGSLLRSSDLALRCDDAEFVFPFGANLVFERAQRVQGRCIFCNRLIREPSDLLVHLVFEHRFPGWRFEYALAQGLLRIHVHPKTEVKVSTLSLPVPVARSYVHSETCEPMLPYEMDEDSEADVDESWIHERAEMLLDEFEDVAENEREVVKLWNRHIRFHSNAGPILDLKFPLICEAFVRDNRDKLKPVKKEVLTHLLHLWDLGLINRHMILECSKYLN